MMTMRNTLLGILALSSAFAPFSAPALHAQEKLPPGAKVAKIEVTPATVALKNPYEYRQLLVTGVLESGERIDVTRHGAGRRRRPRQGVADRRRPAGRRRQGRHQDHPRRAERRPCPSGQPGLKDRYEVSFVRDVMPTLSKMGCNAGTCHGAQNGKNGFKLSLRGYDPLFDHTRPDRRPGRPALQPGRARHAA